MQIPEHINIAEFSKEVGLPPGTVWNHMKQGYCVWPRRQKLGQTSHQLYKTWENIISRCCNPKATGYSNYGGRGIEVCSRWRYSFINFLEDMGEKPGERYTLDRIDVNGHYEPSNCRWATPEEQATNTRKLLGCITKEKTCNSWKVSWRDGKLIKRFKSQEEAEKYLAHLRDDFYGKGAW